MRKPVIAFLMLTLGMTSHAWERYQPGNIAAVIDEQSNTAVYAELKGATDVLISGSEFPYRFRVSFTGKHRMVPVTTQKLIREWAGSIGLGEQVANDFVEQFAFVEAGKTYWLAIQKPIQPAMVEELEPGAQVELYALWVGATTAEHVFLVNRFEPIGVEKK